MILCYGSPSQNNVVAYNNLKMIHSWIKAVGIEKRGQMWQLFSNWKDLMTMGCRNKMMSPRFLTRATGRNASLRKRRKRKSKYGGGADEAPCLRHTETLLVLTWNLEFRRQIWWKAMDLTLSAKESTTSLNELADNVTGLGENTASRIDLW